MGSGAALFDFDGDSDLDVFLVRGDASAEAGGPTGSLWRQDPNGRFVDVTESSGLEPRGFGMGAAAGDVDNDADLDLYLTAYGEDQLWRNQGDGTFVEVSQAWGLRNSDWGTAASFFDYDRDGWLDLFVVNYVEYRPDVECDDGSGRRDYCGPADFEPTTDRLFHNLGRQGDGSVRFEDTTEEAGIAEGPGRGLGLYCRDFNADGLPDIFVANDMEPNRLWIQDVPGHFRDEAIERGAAVNMNGFAEASMGVAFGDFNADGWGDLFLTHLRGQTNTLYQTYLRGVMMDATGSSGLGPSSLSKTGFGVVAADLEHDGDLDLAVVNGRVRRAPPIAAGTPDAYWDSYAEHNQVFLNGGQGWFREFTPSSSTFRSWLEVSRGLAAGDIDDDGDIDFLVSNCGGQARLYRNDFEKRGHWLMVRTWDPVGRRDAIGAQVRVTAGAREFLGECNPSSSYLSANDTRVHFGLGDVERVDAIVVDWPSGTPPRESFPGCAVDRQVILEQGTGTPK